ncbi:MAG: Uma2 family endonuclease [Plectolyngbya sp. WJT66-NPBG17]|jgi:Uma2 family endonuclease|nr:Uma2 family endonuclease [Plectolyngbya sp. WJT66-NPBG17]MBW4525862.1 Uma2 family endonuclease [Phormidium tanganyikae FI6-MK23]
MITNVEIRSLEDWMKDPPKGTEWVDGKLIAKHPNVWVDDVLVEHQMTLRHSRIQANLAGDWKNYKEQQNLGGEIYTEAPCRTQKQGRKPDVAYLTPSLSAQFRDVDILPQSFPLIAEIVSPTDFAENVIAKAQEYLQSGGEEVWLIFPQNQWIIVVTHSLRKVFVSGEIADTQVVLPGFSITVDQLLA